MTKNEFLQRLQALLSDLPEEERREALEYYTEYLQEVEGPNAPEALGSPETAAEELRESRGSQQEAKNAANWAEGYTGAENGEGYGTCLEDEPSAGKAQDSCKQAQSTAQGTPVYARDAQGQTPQRGSWMWLVWLLLLIFLLPALGSVVGVLAGVIGVLIGVVVSGFALVVGGLGGLVAAVPLAAQTFGSGVLTMGICLLLAALGLVLLAGCSWFFTAVLPKLWQGMGRAFVWVKERLAAG